MSRQDIKICVMEGDGIGPEVMEAALPVFEKVNLPISLEFADIGYNCWKAEGETVPDKTWETIKNTDAGLLAAITSKPLQEAESALPKTLQGKNIQFVSPVIQLRQKLDLYANERPVFNILSDNTSPFRICVIRENTEGLYCGLDYAIIPDQIKSVIAMTKNSIAPGDLEQAACTIRLITQKGVERIFRHAFQYAIKNNFKKLTFADKPNVLRYSADFAVRVLKEVAKDFPGIEYEIANADAVALWLVRRPDKFGIIVAENMFGDILSDLAAGIMGGLGLAPSGNIGDKHCYFEPVHGSAPKYAGMHKANPSAMFLSISELLRHFSFEKESESILKAVSDTIKSGKTITYDLGGRSSTVEMSKEIISRSQQ